MLQRITPKKRKTANNLLDCFVNESIGGFVVVVVLVRVVLTWVDVDDKIISEKKCDVVEPLKMMK
jgi:hypothetical protein